MDGCVGTKLHLALASSYLCHIFNVQYLRVTHIVGLKHTWCIPQFVYAEVVKRSLVFSIAIVYEYKVLQFRANNYYNSACKNSHLII